MDPLYKKAIAQGVAGMAVFVAFIFLPAGTWQYWQGWLFIVIFSVSTIGFTVYLALYDRPLLERRMNAGPVHEKEGSQKIIVSLIILAFSFLSFCRHSITVLASRQCPRTCPLLGIS